MYSKSGTQDKFTKRKPKQLKKVKKLSLSRKNSIQCATYKTNKIVEEMKKDLAKQLKEKDREYQQQLKDMEKKYIRDEKEKKKKINEYSAKREKVITGINKRKVTEIEELTKLVRKEQSRNATLEAKISSLVNNAHKIGKKNKALEKKFKTYVNRESNLTIQHQIDLKKLEKKIKDMIEEKKKYHQQFRKSKQNINKLSYLEKQWKQKEMNHLDEIKELKLEHRKILKLRVEKEVNRSEQLMSMLSEELEESNEKNERMQMKLMQLRNMLKEKEQDLEYALKSRKVDCNKQEEEREKMEYEKETAALIENYKREIITIEKQHQAVLQKKEHKLDDTLRQLKNSHQKTLQEQKSFYEKKIQEIRSNFCSQITLTKKEFAEQKNRMDFLLDKKLRDRDGEYNRNIKQKEKEYQGEIDSLKTIYDGKLEICRRSFNDEINTSRIQHQKTLEKLTNDNMINQCKWKAQIEKKIIEFTQMKEEYDALICKLNVVRNQERTEHENCKKQYQKRINFLNSAIKIQSFLESLRFAAASKKWEEETRRISIENKKKKMSSITRN